MKTAIAIAAHPDDIKLMMAGTLLALKSIGYAIHYINIQMESVARLDPLNGYPLLT